MSDAGQGDWVADALADIDNRYLRAVPTIPEPRSAVALVAAVGEGSPEAEPEAGSEAGSEVPEVCSGVAAVSPVGEGSPAAGSEAGSEAGSALLDDVETFIARFFSSGFLTRSRSEISRSRHSKRPPFRNGTCRNRLSAVGGSRNLSLKR